LHFKLRTNAGVNAKNEKQKDVEAEVTQKTAKVTMSATFLPGRKISFAHAESPLGYLRQTNLHSMYWQLEGLLPLSHSGKTVERNIFSVNWCKVQCLFTESAH
jgi:hypothetical protein